MSNLRPSGTSPTPARNGGFSLLEVILALAILAGSIAVLGEAIRLGMRNAGTACDLTQAQLLCESKMAEIAAGLVPLSAIQPTRFDFDVGNGRIGWLYSVGYDQTEEQDMYVVYVTVAQDLPPEKEPTEFTLYRWLPDPNLQLLAESEAEDTGE